MAPGLPKKASTLNLQADKTGRGVTLPAQLGGGFRTKLDAKLTGWVWTLAGGYTLWHNARANVDGLIGFRLLDLTSSGYTGVGYAFDWGELTLTYRYLHYEMPDHMELEDATFWGPALGANVRF